MLQEGVLKINDHKHLRIIYKKHLCQPRDTMNLYLNVMNLNLHKNFASQISCDNYLLNCNVFKIDFCMPLCSMVNSTVLFTTVLFICIYPGTCPQGCNFTLFLCIFYNLKLYY